MNERIGPARGENIDRPFLLGGAAVTEEQARPFGAHDAKNGGEAVKLLERLNAKTARSAR
ncbi:MAG: hypothetical protein JXD23_02460 [Spirochaetales bacterium]|nr:hypothetical protein [Spirochaetales bacterium]